MVYFLHGTLVIMLLEPKLRFPEIQFLSNGGALRPPSGHGMAAFFIFVSRNPDAGTLSPQSRVGAHVCSAESIE